MATSSKRATPLGLNFQIAPENTDDALVYSGYYLARVSDKLSLMLKATKQDSDVSTLGGAAVAGNGEIVGMRAMLDLPTTQKFYQSFNFGIDYKNFDEDVVIGKDTITAPIEYYPLSAQLLRHLDGGQAVSPSSTPRSTSTCAAWAATRRITRTNATTPTATSSILRGDAAHTHDLKGGCPGFRQSPGPDRQPSR